VLGCREPAVERNSIEARLHTGKVQWNTQDAVVEQERNALPGPNATSAQRVAQPVTQQVNLREGQGLVCEGNRDARAVLAGTAFDNGSKLHAAIKTTARIFGGSGLLNVLNSARVQN